MQRRESVNDGQFRVYRRALPNVNHPAPILVLRDERGVLISERPHAFPREQLVVAGRDAAHNAGFDVRPGQRDLGTTKRLRGPHAGYNSPNRARRLNRGLL